MFCVMFKRSQGVENSHRGTQKRSDRQDMPPSSLAHSVLIKAGQSISDIMQAHNIPEGMIWKRIRLAFLSPKILRAIVDGTSNRDLTIKMLTRHDLPLDWSEQQALFLS